MNEEGRMGKLEVGRNVWGLRWRDEGVLFLGVELA